MADLFYEGQEFTNCEQFLLLVDQYNEKTNIQLSRRDSTKMAYYCKKRQIENIYTEFTHYDFHYVCPKSGEFMSKGKQKRHVLSQKTNCPVKLIARVDIKVKRLVVKTWNNIHQHEQDNNIKKASIAGTSTYDTSVQDLKSSITVPSNKKPNTKIKRNNVNPSPSDHSSYEDDQNNTNPSTPGHSVYQDYENNIDPSISVHLLHQDNQNNSNPSTSDGPSISPTNKTAIRPTFFKSSNKQNDIKTALSSDYFYINDEGGLVKIPNEKECDLDKILNEIRTIVLLNEETKDKNLNLLRLVRDEIKTTNDQSTSTDQDNNSDSSIPRTAVLVDRELADREQDNYSVSSIASTVVLADREEDSETDSILSRSELDEQLQVVDNNNKSTFCLRQVIIDEKKQRGRPKITKRPPIGSQHLQNTKTSVTSNDSLATSSSNTILNSSTKTPNTAIFTTLNDTSTTILTDISEPPTTTAVSISNGTLTAFNHQTNTSSINASVTLTALVTSPTTTTSSTMTDSLSTTSTNANESSSVTSISTSYDTNTTPNTNVPLNLKLTSSNTSIIPTSNETITTIAINIIESPTITTISTSNDTFNAVIYSSDTLTTTSTSITSTAVVTSPTITTFSHMTDNSTTASKNMNEFSTVTSISTLNNNFATTSTNRSESSSIGTVSSSDGTLTATTNSTDTLTPNCVISALSVAVNQTNPQEINKKIITSSDSNSANNPTKIGRITRATTINETVHILSPDKQDSELERFLQHLILKEQIMPVINKTKKITVNDLSNQIKNLSDAVPYQFKKFKNIRMYFKRPAYKALLKAIEIKNKNGTWTCHKCLKKIDDNIENSIACSNCWYWYHDKCARVNRKILKSGVWFCSHCK